MSNTASHVTLEVLYHHVDRVGVVPQVNEFFPCDEAPGGRLFVIEKEPILRAGRRIGWTIKGHH
jgi:hypothetical protein